MKQSNHFAYGLLAIATDALTLIAALFILPQLITRMETPGGWNALLVSGAFLLFIIGTFMIRRMMPTAAGTAEWLTRGQRSVLALIFAFFFSLALAWQLGFFRSAFLVDTTEMGEGGSSSYFVYGPGAWLAFSLAYVLVFAFRVEPRIESGSRGYWTAAVFGLATTAVMTLVLAAHGQAIAQQFGGGWLWSLITFAVLILLFLPARLLYLSRTTGLRTMPGYLATAGLVILLGVLAMMPAG